VEYRIKYDGLIDPHYILGVPVNASKSEISAAYRKLSKYHPDKIKDMDEYKKHVWNTISNAYNTLREGNETGNYVPNIYEMLNVPFTESIDIITEKYNEIRKKYDDNNINMKNAYRKIKYIDEIYYTLINPVKRERYDSELKANGLYNVNYLANIFNYIYNNIIRIILLCIYLYILYIIYKSSKKAIYDKKNIKINKPTKIK
jgi:DnaJ-class molecular chaperone